MHIVSTSSVGDRNRNKLKNDCYIEVKFFSYKLFKFRFEDDPKDVKTGSTSPAMQRLNRAMSLCIMFVFSLAVISIAFALHQVFAVQEQQLANTNLQRDVTKLRQNLFKSEENERLMQQEYVNLKEYTEEIKKLHQQLVKSNEQAQQYITQLQQKLFKSEESGRFSMFKIHLAYTSNILTEQDLKTLASKTDGYSEGDISKIVSDVLKQRVRMLQTATHFKKVRGASPLDNNQIVDDLITPCSPGDAGAFKMTVKDVPKGKLFAPPVMMGDMLKSLANIKSNVGDGDLKN